MLIALVTTVWVGGRLIAIGSTSVSPTATTTSVPMAQRRANTGALDPLAPAFGAPRLVPTNSTMPLWRYADHVRTRAYAPRWAGLWHSLPMPPVPDDAPYRTTDPAAVQSVLLLRHSGDTLIDPADGPPPALVPPDRTPTDSISSTRSPHSARTMSRWSASAWLALRQGNGVTPVQAGPRSDSLGGSLGGSQTGLRLAYRLDPSGHWRGFARIVSTGRAMRGAEGAIGVEWQPLQRLPLRLIAERRAPLFGTGGRSAMAAYAVAGVDDRRLSGSFRLDGYAAAGVIGTVNRDMFAETALRIHRPLLRAGPLHVDAGLGAWGAAQPGLRRVDVGPMLSIRHDASPLRLTLDWRQRIAGQAAPGSGPALTLASDF